MSLNQWTGLGRLTRDPEVKSYGEDGLRASFSLAVDRDFKDKNGERGTDFIDCTAWGKTAELCKQWLRKGKQVVVSGRLELRSWVDADGQKRRTYSVRVASINFTGSKGDAPSSASGGEAELIPLNDDDGELPF